MADLRNRTVVQGARADAEALLRNPNLTTYEHLIVRALAHVLDRLDAALARRQLDMNPIPNSPPPPPP